MSSFNPLKVALAFLFVATVDAFFRIDCGVIQTGRVDSVVNPGSYAEHAHTLVGSANIGVNSTYDTLYNSPCSSCQIQKDLSAYWTPLLYYHYPNGTFIEVPHGGSVIYYLGRGVGGETKSIVPFPRGFQMLSGNKAARSYDNQTMTWGNAQYPGRPVADRVSFACLTAGPGGPEQPYMFTPTLCVNNMRAQIAFQSCWNGKDLYKTDNSHVAYLSGIDNGVCPPSHPVYLPIVFMETSYATSIVPPHEDGTPLEDSRFVFSQGDPTGFGFHGDFVNGWDDQVQLEAVENCLYNDPSYGTVEECPALMRSNTNGAAYNCPEQPPAIDEPVHGLLDRLPGCIEITYGPEAAPASSMKCGPEDPPPPPIIATRVMTARATVSPTPGANYGISSQQRYLGCFNDTGGGGYRTLNSISTSNYTVMTVQYCQQWCADRGYRLSGVEYAQECHCDNYINPTAISAQSGNESWNSCTWNCGGTLTARFDGEQQLCGGLGHIDVYNNTDPDFDAFGDNSNTAGNAQPYTPAAGFGENYLGCYSDTGVRTLSGASTEALNMTVERCADYCAAQNNGVGYQYYGLEYYSQCFCGNAINPEARLLTPDTSPSNYSCSFRCTGKGSEICGGASVMSLYNVSDFRGPEAKPSVGKYATQRCLTDPANEGRALQGNYTSRPDMTIEHCVKFCLGSFYHYAGVEFGHECFCGNEIVTSTGATAIDCDVTQVILCPGNNYQFCGGRSFMNLYYSPTL
ncbi:WSC-domain-containing protein [Hortaea werneckii]|nr:WSC-domain-containing protein [Hortaea werneckii]